MSGICSDECVGDPHRCVEAGDYFDVIFSVHSHVFRVHRSVLSVSCDYFSHMFANKWKNRKIIYINHSKVVIFYKSLHYN
jgi:hypothetical protein